MIATFGNITLWLALFFSTLQFIISNQKINYLKERINSISIKSVLICSLISFLSLIYSYIISDFTVENVFQNSHTSKPLIYKISATWGNHEGSMLLWILILSVFNYLIFSMYNDKNSKLLIKALATQAFISVGFILFTLLTSNPFNKIIPNQNDGLGFNPILQDPALAIHPPLLYIGYVGFSAAFSISVATLHLGNKENIKWHTYMKPFVMSAWAFLTIGIAFGSLWAYYELGWGGWWFWDPVENASLMPWLLGTALVHSLITVEKKKSLTSWVLLLAILTFLLSVLGTFLVRSGILTSVHTFALDPERGIYILTFTAILGFYSLILYGIKSKQYFDVNYFSIISKEGAILVNNIIMIIVCSTVFLGTIYPLLIEIFSNNKISVGEPYYNSIVIPIFIPAILIMGIGPILSWGKDSINKTLRELLPNFILTIILTIGLFLIYKSYSLVGIIGIFLGFWIIINNLIILIKKNLPTKISKKLNWLNIRRLSNGMIASHLGVGLLIIGITGSSIWQDEEITRLKINDSINFKEYKIIFKNLNEIKGPNYVAIQGNFSVYNNKNKFITELNPQNRFYIITKNITTEASIHTNLLRDLYLVLGDGNVDNGWIIRIYNNPLVVWIWVGAFIMFIGGLLSLRNSLKTNKYIKQ